MERAPECKFKSYHDAKMAPRSCRKRQPNELPSLKPLAARQNRWRIGICSDQHKTKQGELFLANDANVEHPQRFLQTGISQNPRVRKPKDATTKDEGNKGKPGVR